MPLSPHDRHGQQATCVRCLELRDTSELDRLFWCVTCRRRATDRAARVGFLVGALVAALLGVWIFVVVEPSAGLMGVWVAIIVAALYLAFRIAREVGYGWMRLKNRRAVEATPPEGPGEGAGGGAPPDGAGGP